jgi:hypothetical protein
MPGPGSSPGQALVPGIHVFGHRKQDVDGRDKPGHDEWVSQHQRPLVLLPVRRLKIARLQQTEFSAARDTESG